MTRMVPAAAGLALALAVMSPILAPSALARQEGTFQPGAVASPDLGPAAAGVRQYRPGEEQYNDGTQVAVPPAPPTRVAHHGGGYPPGRMYNDGTQTAF